MTPKEKAEELVNIFKQVEIYDTNEPDFYCKIKDITSFNYTAKHCALIAVDTVLWMASHYATIDYWNEVKQEIEKL